MFKNVGLQLYSVRNHMEDIENVRETFKRLAEIGYTEAQTAGGFIGGVEAFADAAESAGIKIVGTHYAFPENLNELDEYIAIHKTLGTTNAGVGGGKYGSTKAEVMQYIENVNILADKLSRHGIKFTYHHHTHEFGKVDGKPVFQYMVDGFDKKNVSFVLDTYWLSHAGCDVNAWIEKLTGRVDILHLKDKAVKIGSNDGYITEVGNGNLDFKSILSVAEASGVKHICVEQDSWPEDSDSLECAKKSYDYLASILGL